MKKTFLVILAFCISFSIITCSKLTGFLPNKVLKDYYEAQKNKDWGTVYDLLSEELKVTMSNLINSPQGERELKAMKLRNPKLKIDTTRDKFIAFLQSQDKKMGEFIAYEIIEVPKVNKGEAEITAIVSETRKISGREQKKVNNIVLKLEDDGWKIKGKK